jgi:hypothetical protein
VIGEIVFLGKLILGTIIAVAVITVVQFLSTLLELLMPLLKVILPLFEKAIQTLVQFLQAATPVVTQAVQWAWRWFKTQVLSVVGHYRLLNEQQVAMAQEVFITESNDRLRRVLTESTIDASELPDYIREALFRTGKLSVHHDRELTNEIELRIHH